MGTGLSGDEVEYLASCGEGIGGGGLDIKVEQVEFIAVMGKSGCGKTTFLKILGLIDQPTAGEIL